MCVDTSHVRLVTTPCSPSTLLNFVLASFEQTMEASFDGFGPAGSGALVVVGEVPVVLVPHAHSNAATKATPRIGERMAAG